MPIWLYLTCVLFLCAIILLWSLERRMRRCFSGLPTYPPLPFIGNLHQILGDGKSLFCHLVRIASVIEERRLPFAVWVGPCPILVIQDLDDIKTITNTFVEKPYYYNFGRVWLGNGLVTAPAPLWKRNIKKLAGTFTTSVVDGYLSVFNAQAHKLVQNLIGEVGKEPFDIMHKYLAYSTLESICQTALGVQKISESIVTTEYYEAFNRCLELLVARGLNGLLHPEFIYRLTPSYREMKKSVAVLHNVSDTVMKKRQLERSERNKLAQNSENTENGLQDQKFKAFLDILMDLSLTDATLTDQQIQSEVDTIIVGGQETVASTLFYALLMIGCNPGIQAKLYTELKNIFGDSKRPVTKEDLSKMTYCEAIIHETLRLYPPVPGFMRYIDRDIQLKSCLVPKGTTCGINAWGAGRSERVWGPDAWSYRPERWLDGQPPGNPAGFLAFSYGRRACIGKRYAMAILKTMLAHCVRELEFLSEADKMEFKVDLALRPIAGHLIRVRLRE